MACGIQADSALYRFIILFFTCMLTFGSYYCFDMPSVLQDQLQQNETCNDTEGYKHQNNCCVDCLTLNSVQYNLLYAIYAWTNAIVVIGSGLLVDKLGNRVGVFLFSSLCVLGSSIFALGSHFKSTAIAFPVMLIGRLLFGAGNGSLTIVQNRITAFWFKNKELALAFGVTLAFSRLGSVLNFFLTDYIYNSVGLQYTLWIGAMLCGAGFISAVIVSFLDVAGVRELGLDQQMATESKKMRFTDIKSFSISYWLLCLTIMFFYNGVFPFVADASKFIQDKYDKSRDVSAYMAGAVYDVSMILSPFLGGLIDIFGQRGCLALICGILTIPVFGILAFTRMNPLITTLWLGVTYSFAAASMWPSIPLVIQHSTLGTAMGLATSIQMIGIGISNSVVGAILGDEKTEDIDEILYRWKFVMIYLLINALLCVVTAAILNMREKRKGGILNLSRKEMQALLDKQDDAPSTEVSDDIPSSEEEKLLPNPVN